MTALVNVEGIGKVYGRKLQAAGIRSTNALLEAGASPQGRKEIARETGLSPAKVLEWVNRVDLARIRGVGKEYSDLLEQAGVDSVVELAQRNPANVLEAMAKVNQTRSVVRRLPTQPQVADWVRQAKRLPRVVKY